MNEDDLNDLLRRAEEARADLADKLEMLKGKLETLRSEEWREIMTEENKEKEEIMLVCLGIKAVEGGKKLHIYKVHDYDRTKEYDQNEPEDRFVLSVPLGSGKRSSDVLGGIYKGNITRDKSGNLHSAYNVGSWSYMGRVDKRMRSKLSIQNQTEKATLDTRKAIEAARKENAFKEILDPIKQAYRGMNWSKRQALLAYIIREITS